MRALFRALLIILIIWLVFFIFGKSAIPYGIHPRDTSALKGIVFCPFIHANITHLISNTIPLFILTFLLALAYKNSWFAIFMFISVLGGAMVWLFARSGSAINPVYHVGASITIFGLITFLITAGLRNRTFRDILISIIVALTYGGALWGVLPSNPNISWEGHLFGAISGVLVALMIPAKKQIYKQQ